MTSISFSISDRATITSIAARCFHCGEPAENGEILLRNIVWNLNSMMSWQRDGTGVSVRLESGAIVALKIKHPTRRFMIPVSVRSDRIVISGQTYILDGDDDAMTIAEAIMQKIEQGPTYATMK